MTSQFLSGTGGGGTGSFTWVTVTGTSQSIQSGMGYFANNSSLITFTLPVTCTAGETFQIAGKGTGSWTIAQNAGQYIVFGNQQTTTGVTGSLDATYYRDTVEIVCSEDDTEFQILDSQGNLELT